MRPICQRDAWRQPFSCGSATPPRLAGLRDKHVLRHSDILQQVVVTRKFGPVKFERLRKLTEFKFLSITDHSSTDKDGCITSIFYHVSLCGGKGTKPIMLSSFDKRKEAAIFAHEVGAALKLPGKDYVGTEPDEDA